MWLAFIVDERIMAITHSLTAMIGRQVEYVHVHW